MNPSRRMILRASCAAMLLGCGPADRPRPVRVIQGDEQAVREQERRYLAAGLPGLPREVRVRVVSSLGLLPEGTASPGALGGTWPSGDVDVVDPRHLPHELLHSAAFLGGDPTGDRAHRDARWAAVPR